MPQEKQRPPKYTFDETPSEETLSPKYSFEDVRAEGGESPKYKFEGEDPELENEDRPVEETASSGFSDRAKSVLANIPYSALKAVQGVTKPLLAPLEGTNFDSNKLLAESVDWWRNKAAPGPGIPNFGVGLDKEGSLEFQKRPSIPIRDIAGETAGAAGFVAGPLGVASRAAGLVTAKLASKARPFYQSIAKGMITGGLVGEGKKTQTLESMALFGVFEPLAYGLGKVSRVPQAIKASAVWRKLSVKEKGSVIQTLDQSVQQSAKHVELLKRNGAQPYLVDSYIKSIENKLLKDFSNPTWREEALSRRGLGVEATSPSSPPTSPASSLAKQPKPIPYVKPKLKTQAALDFQEAIKAENQVGKARPMPKVEADVKNINDDSLLHNQTLGQLKQNIVFGNLTGVNQELKGVLKRVGRDVMADWLNPAKVGGRLNSDAIKMGFSKQQRDAVLKSSVADYEKIYNNVWKSAEEMQFKQTPNRTVQAEGNTNLFAGIPIHKFPKAAKELGDLYDKYVGKPLWDAFSEKLPVALGKKIPLIDYFNKGTIYDYRKPKEYIKVRDDAQMRIAQYRKKAREIADTMAKFSPGEQSRLSQIIRGSVTATPKRYEKAFEAVKAFQKLERELQSMGLLGPDNYLKQFTRKELATKFKEVEELGKKIKRKEESLKPHTVVVSKKAKDIAEEVTEKIVTKQSETGGIQTAETKWTKLNEERVNEALRARGFGEGEAAQMVSRIKESVIPLEGGKGFVKETTKTINKVVTRIVTQEIVKAKKYSRSYMARARGSIIKDINQLTKDRKGIEDRIKQHYKMSGKLYLKRAYDTIEKQDKALSYIKRAFVNPRFDLGYSKQRKVLTKEEKDKLGIITRAPYLVYKGLATESHDIVLAKMFDRIAKNKDWAIDAETLLTLKAGNKGEKYVAFKPLPTTKKLGPLSGKLVDPYIWDDLNQMVVSTSEMVKAWDYALSLWKTGKVVYNPATQCRNLLSNIVLSYFNGLSPHRVDIYARAAKELWTKGPFWRTADKYLLFGEEWAGTEIKRFLSDTAALELKLNPKTGRYEHKEDFFSLSAKTARSLLDLPGKSYQGMEQFFKLANFIYKMEGKPLSDKVAVKAAKDSAESAIFNYQKIPPAVRTAKRWYAPFITFPYKAIPKFAETSIRAPWRIITVLGLLKGVEEVSRRMNGESKEQVELEKKVLPDYMRKTILPGQLSHVRVGYKDIYGRSKYVDASYIAPWGDIAEQWGQSHFVGRPFLPSNPVFTLAAEIASNTVLFTGQELTSEVDEGSDYWKKIGKQVWRQAVPSLAGSYSSNKLMAAYTGEKDWALRERSLPEAVFDVFFGLKIRSIDYSEERGKRLTALRGKLAEIKAIHNKEYIKLTMRITPDPDDEEKHNAKIEKLWAKTNAQLDKIMNRILAIDE